MVWDPKSWDEAFGYCRVHGLNFAVPRSKTDNRKFIQVTHQNKTGEKPYFSIKKSPSCTWAAVPNIKFLTVKLTKFFFQDAWRSFHLNPNGKKFRDIPWVSCRRLNSSHLSFYLIFEVGFFYPVYYYRLLCCCS